jgi:hypothetical protein
MQASATSSVSLPGNISRLLHVAAVVCVVLDKLLQSHLAVSAHIRVVSVCVEHDDGEGEQVGDLCVFEQTRLALDALVIRLLRESDLRA